MAPIVFSSKRAESRLMSFQPTLPRALWLTRADMGAGVKVNGVIAALKEIQRLKTEGYAFKEDNALASWRILCGKYARGSVTLQRGFTGFKIWAAARKASRELKVYDGVAPQCWSGVVKLGHLLVSGCDRPVTDALNVLRPLGMGPSNLAFAIVAYRRALGKNAGLRLPAWQVPTLHSTLADGRERPVLVH